MAVQFRQKIRDVLLYWKVLAIEIPNEKIFSHVEKYRKKYFFQQSRFNIFTKKEKLKNLNLSKTKYSRSLQLRILSFWYSCARVTFLKAQRVRFLVLNNSLKLSIKLKYQYFSTWYRLYRIRRVKSDRLCVKSTNGKRWIEIYLFQIY